MRVVLVHGYLAPGAVMWPLAARLRRAGHTTTLFKYRSHRGDIARHVKDLRTFIQSGDGAPFALVSHSMGGLVVHAALDDAQIRKPQAAVFIATPHNGSRLARAVRKGPLARFMSDGARVLASGVNLRPSDVPCGVIVGLKDRTVRPAEARFSGATDQLDLPYGHNELLVRPQTAAAVTRFIKTGRFETRERLLWADI